MGLFKRWWDAQSARHEAAVTQRKEAAGFRLAKTPKSAKPQVKVVNYTRRGQMERDFKEALSKGWRIEHQTGEFDKRFVLGQHHDKVTVTYVREAP